MKKYKYVVLSDYAAHMEDAADGQTFYDASEVDIRFAQDIVVMRKQREKIAEMEKLLRDLDEHFALLDKNGVHVWPNHPLNPRKRIREILGLMERATHESK